MKKTIAPALTLGFVGAALAAAATPASAAVYYPNCDAAVAAHAAPINKGEPGYRPALDRNDNNVACENATFPAGYVKKTVSRPAQPVPAKPTTPAPVSTTPAPVVQTPAKTSQPAPATPAVPSAGPKVNTDFVSTGNSSTSTLAAFSLLAGAAGAGAWRVRSAGKR